MEQLDSVYNDLLAKYRKERARTQIGEGKKVSLLKGDLEGFLGTQTTPFLSEKSPAPPFKKGARNILKRNFSWRENFFLLFFT